MEKGKRSNNRKKIKEKSISNNKKENTKKYQKIEDNKKGENTKTKKKGFWKRHRKLALFIKIVIVLIILMCIAAAGAVIAIIKSDNWKITKEDLTLNSIDTIIYDSDGNEIANVSGDEKRRIVTLDKIPQDLQDAYISIEDERYYSHKGVDIKRTTAVTIKYIINRGSSTSGGGSTITQQVIKNILRDNDDTGLAGIQRKIREISRAFQVEKILSKSQILELYLNTIFVGGDVYGVELGAQYYFNKSVEELDLAECAFLAGINHSPNSYNPYGDTDNTAKIEKRTKTVLAKMKELGKITDEESNTAVNKVEEGFNFEKGDTTSGTAMSYVARAALNQVINQYAEENGVSTEFAKTKIEGGGFKIYTTQDSNIQAKLEEVYRSGEYVYSGRNKDSEGNLINTHTQSAMVIIDHKTGNVVGCMGGLGDDVNSNGLNRATQSTRQPGSAIKPIASIAPALEKGIITASTIYDESPSYFGNFHPTNSGEGLITVRRAIKISANTTEVKIMSELGPANAIEFMKKMGITSLVTSSEDAEHNDENLSMVLGGLTYGITPLEMAGAYATIANDGVYITPTFYTRVENSSGETILEPVQEHTRVMSEANAYIEKTILTGPVTSGGGTAPYCKISGHDTGGKTGTTTSNVDRWFCGFTSYYTAATWYGYDRNQEPLKGDAVTSNKAARLWAEVMEMVHEDLPNSSFEKPSNVTTATICLDSGKLATDKCSRTYTEYFAKGTVPDYCEGHTTLKICKETGKIATEYCQDVEEKTYVTKPEKEDTTLWKTDDGGKYDIPTETCTVHTQKLINIPNVVGKTSKEAKEELEALGLKVTIETKESSDDKKGKVISQSKKEGSTAKQGDTITITVGKGASNTNTNTNTIVNNTEKPSENTITNSTQNNINSNEI